MIWKYSTTYTGIKGMKSSIMRLSDDASTILSMSEVRAIQKKGYFNKATDSVEGSSLDPSIVVYYESFKVVLNYTADGLSKALEPTKIDYENWAEDYTWLNEQIFGKKSEEEKEESKKENEADIKESLKLK